MKDSGIPWIGEIPEHWEVKKMRSIFRLAHEKTEEERTDLLSLSQYTGIRYKSQCDKTGMFEAESTVGYNIVHKGQFVMNIMLAWNGSFAVSVLEGIISPSYCIFDFKEDCDKRYFNYLLRTEMYQGEFKANSKGLIDSRLRLYPDYFFPIGVVVPPIEEQKAISDYIVQTPEDRPVHDRPPARDRLFEGVQAAANKRCRYRPIMYNKTIRRAQQ